MKDIIKKIQYAKESVAGRYSLSGRRGSQMRDKDFDSEIEWSYLVKANFRRGK